MLTNLTIVIPSHSRADLLERCLRSVTAYAPPDTEVIVVDDGSPAGAVSRTANQFVGVRSLRLPRRSGFCVAVNRGIAAANGQVIELLNDDTEVTSGWAEPALKHFAKPVVGAVAPLVLLGNSDNTRNPIVDSAGDRYYLGGVAGKRGHGSPLSSEHLQPESVFGASGSSAFYRRSALLDVGGFPVSFGAYFEDVDVSFRLRRAGYEILYEPAARIYHKGSASHGKKDPRLLAQMSLNEERVFWRNVPGILLLRGIRKHVAVLAGKAWRRWSHGELRPFLLGRFRILGEIGAIKRHRRCLSGNRADQDCKSWLIDESYWG